MRNILRLLCAVTLETLSGAGVRSSLVTLRNHRLIAATESSQGESTCGVHCGTERWTVKTLSDTDASQVKATPVTKTDTFSALLGLSQTTFAQSRVEAQ
jgi:hypothetical protein